MSKSKFWILTENNNADLLWTDITDKCFYFSKKSSHRFFYQINTWIGSWIGWVVILGQMAFHPP